MDKCCARASATAYAECNCAAGAYGIRNYKGARESAIPRGLRRSIRSCAMAGGTAYARSNATRNFYADYGRAIRGAVPTANRGRAVAGGRASSGNRAAARCAYSIYNGIHARVIRGR